MKVIIIILIHVPPLEKILVIRIFAVFGGYLFICEPYWISPAVSSVFQETSHISNFPTWLITRIRLNDTLAKKDNTRRM